jgi:hypothetical protein
MSISITKVENFSENSFEFEDPVGNKFGSESIGLVSEDGGPLLLSLKDCLAIMGSAGTKSLERKTLPFH